MGKLEVVAERGVESRVSGGVGTEKPSGVETDNAGANTGCCSICKINIKK